MSKTRKLAPLCESRLADARHRRDVHGCSRWQYVRDCYEWALAASLNEGWSDKAFARALNETDRIADAVWGRPALRVVQ